MAIIYPMQRIGQFGLWMGFCYRLLHEKFGFDFGKRYHKDIEYKVKTTMEIDRAVYDAYKTIGLGFENPFPRVAVEPFGHRFMPAMYGCECTFESGSEPWGNRRNLTPEEIEVLKPWTVERFENAEPVREVLTQSKYLRKHYDLNSYIKPSELCPHYRTLSSLQNLGSVINTGFVVRGEDLLLDYMDRQDLVRKFYENITELMLLCLHYFPEFDRQSLTHVFVGNCQVATISPNQYMDCNFKFDIQLVNYAREIKAQFLMHQDSDATPHLENYAKFRYVQVLELGQDTDWEKAASLFPNCDASCILFPAWLRDHSKEEIHGEILRLMHIGKNFKSFSFTLYEIDHFMGGEKMFEFYETFRQCAEKAG